MGIPVFVPQQKIMPQSRPWHSLVGTMPDSEVADLGGVTSSNVYHYRKVMGIPKFQSKQMKTELST
jgi:hypothetical protein